MDKKYRWVKDATLLLKGAEFTYKGEWECYRMLVGGKMFGMLGHNNTGDEILTLKGDPAENAQRREFYSFIIPGYYMNKDHWISFLLQHEEMDTALAAEQIKQAYQLIYEKLPKKERERIEALS